MKTTRFWNSSGSIKLDPESVHKFLSERGFHTIKTYEENKILVEVRGNIAHRVSQEYIREYCWNYINKEFAFDDADERRQVIDVFQHSQSPLNYANLILLDEIEINDIKDNEESSYLFFKNCLIKVTAEGAEKILYVDIDGYIWQDDIIEFEFVSDIPSDITPLGEFYEFFLDITMHNNISVQGQNQDSLVTIIGHFLHRYKVPSKAKALILMDSYKDGNPEGGSGKGILSQAFGKVRPTVYQDGKFFKRSDKFALSNLKFGTRILAIDDVPDDFSFVRMFPIITDRTVVERKYENKIVIPFNTSPKIIITTNYTILGKGNSHKRRKVEYILSNTYGADYTPEDKFGHLMYQDWNEDEWINFYLFMIYCIQMYLLLGLITPNFNVAERTLKMNTPESFRTWALLSCPGEKFIKKTEFEEYISDFPEQANLEQNTFTRWLKLYADAHGWEMNETHSGNDNFFEFIDPNASEQTSQD